MRYFQRSISDFTCLFTENSAEQTLFCCQFGLSLRGYLTYKDISCTHFCADADDTSLIQVLQRVIAYARDIAGDLFRPKLGIAGLRLIFFNVYGCVNIILYQSFT